MINAKLLEDVRNKLKEKEAYTPPMTDPAAAALAGGAAPPMGGAPPMGAPPMGAPPMGAPPMGAPPMGAPPMGAPPMGGGMPPMDPSMLAGLDPNMLASLGITPEMLGMPPMGGAPPMGAPPMSPMGGEQTAPIGPEEPQVVQLNMADLQAILQEAIGGKAPDSETGEEAPKEEGSEADVSTRLSAVEDMMGTLFSALGLPIPGSEAGIPGSPEAVPGATSTEIAPPEGFSLLGAPPGAGGEIGGAAPGAPQASKQASGPELMKTLRGFRDLKN